MVPLPKIIIICKLAVAIQFVTLLTNSAVLVLQFQVTFVILTASTEYLDHVGG